MGDAVRARAVGDAVREAGLDPSYALAVDAMLDEDEAGWPMCCGSSCDPCVLVLAHAARDARARIRATHAGGGAGGPAT